MLTFSQKVYVLICLIKKFKDVLLGCVNYDVMTKETLAKLEPKTKATKSVLLQALGYRANYNKGRQSDWVSHTIPIFEDRDIVAHWCMSEVGG